MRAGDDHADQAVRICRNRASVESGELIGGACKAVGQRVVEHVVCHLPGAVARAAGCVEEPELETTEAWFSRSALRVRAAVNVVFAIERAVVFKDEGRDLGGWEGRLFCRDVDTGAAGRDGSAAHAVTAGARCRVSSWPQWDR